MPDIPLIVDDIVLSEGFPITRLIYFHVEGEDTLEQWSLEGPNYYFPFLMVGLAGIIVQPGDSRTTFTDPREISELFDSIEASPHDSDADSPLMVQTGDVWLPTDSLRKQHAGLTRGDVFRIPFELFRLAFGFRSDRLAVEEFFSRFHDTTGSIRFSEIETKVFTDWALSESDRRPERAFTRDLHLPRRQDFRE